MALVDDFKNALSSWASGVSVVTAKHEGLVYGLTVSSFSSLSIEPPLILVCVANKNRIGEMVQESGAFSVSLLAADQSDISGHFARSGRVPEAELGHPASESANGIPVLDHAIGSVACELHQVIPVATHTILVGRVVAAAADEQRQPLVYFRRGYRAVSQ